MKKVKITNPTGMQVQVLNHRILPWDQAPDGQVIEVSAANLNEFLADLKTHGLPIKAELVDDQKKTARKPKKPAASASKSQQAEATTTTDEATD